MEHSRSLTLLGTLLVALALAFPPVCHGWQEQEKAEPQTEGEKAQQAEIEAKACGPSENKLSARTDKSQHPTPEPPPGKALIYVIRPTLMGNKIQTKLGVDGKWVGANRGDNYFFLTLEPGQHYFCSQAENRSAIALKLEADKTYYLQQKIRMGFMKARNELALLEEAEGKKGLAKCHLSVSEEKGK